MEISQLPALNAALNATAFVLLVLGWRAIRAGRIARHRAFMVSALAVSATFLASYLVYHYHHGSTPFAGEGAIRPVYYGILLTHTVLATVQVPLIVTTVAFAARDNFARHRRWARVTWPIWAYVSLTGVLIYLMLYHWFAAPGGA